MKPQNEPNADERALLDQLLCESRLYHTSQDFMELLDFTVRLRNMAPFNAMLLQIQKPGLSYAASSHEWRHQFNREVKEGARPLPIMWPFAPVALVYDIQDTEGEPLPTDAFAFYCAGEITHDRIARFEKILENRNMRIEWFDGGDLDAGSIKPTGHPEEKDAYTPYQIRLNQNHPATTIFCTLVHELAHLYLGHLGKDLKLKITDRKRSHAICEIEAESVAYLVCKRNGLEPRSKTYLHQFVKSRATAESLDLYAITRSAGGIERLLGLSKTMKLQS